MIPNIPGSFARTRDPSTPSHAPSTLATATAANSSSAIFTTVEPSRRQLDDWTDELIGGPNWLVSTNDDPTAIGGEFVTDRLYRTEAVPTNCS